MPVARCGWRAGSDRGHDEQEQPFENRCPGYGPRADGLRAAFRHYISFAHTCIPPSDINTAAFSNLDTDGNVYVKANPARANLHIHANTMACRHAVSHTNAR